MPRLGNICQMFGCFNYATYPVDRRTGEKIRFHRFPKDSMRQNKWIICCRRADLLKSGIQSNRNRLVCSKHFDSSMYNNPADVQFSSLRHDAYPNLVPLEKIPTKEPRQRSTSKHAIKKHKRQLLEAKMDAGVENYYLTSTSFASEIVRPSERQKSPGPPLLERNPLSPQEPSTSSNLKGPYSLRKGKSKQYALMLKGFDLSGDEEDGEEDKKEEAKEEMEQHEKKKKEKKEEKEEVIMENDPYQFKAEDSKGASISGDSEDSSNSSCVEVVREKVVRPKPEKRSPETAEEKFGAMHVPVKLDISSSDSATEQEDPEEPEEPVRSRLVNGGFTCRRCRAKFPHKQLYLAHRFRQGCSRRESRFGCGECRVPCGHEEALQVHTASHTSWGSSQLCLLCRKVVMWKDLFDHLRAHRFGRFGLADC